MRRSVVRVAEPYDGILAFNQLLLNRIYSLYANVLVIRSLRHPTLCYNINPSITQPPQLENYKVSR